MKVVAILPPGPEGSTRYPSSDSRAGAAARQSCCLPGWNPWCCLLVAQVQPIMAARTPLSRDEGTSTSSSLSNYRPALQQLQQQTLDLVLTARDWLRLSR